MLTAVSYAVAPIQAAKKKRDERLQIRQPQSQPEPQLEILNETEPQPDETVLQTDETVPQQDQTGSEIETERGSSDLQEDNVSDNMPAPYLVSEMLHHIPWIPTHMYMLTRRQHVHE